MSNKQPRFPVGGSKDAVFKFLGSYGFIMSKWSDKHWLRADGLSVHVYGSGSQARVYDKGHTAGDRLLADGPLEAAVNKATGREP